jgi:hypothetical protein
MGDAADLIKGEMQKLVPPSQRALVRNSGGFPLGAQMSQPTICKTQHMILRCEIACSTNGRAY